MGKVSVKVSNYIGGLAVDYAKKYWSKVASGDPGDGRVLTSIGPNPACGQKGFPDGTELFHEPGWSQAYGGPSQSDFVVVPESGSSWQEATETFEFQGTILEKKKAKLKEDPTKWIRAASENYALKKYLVKSIDKVEVQLDSGPKTLTKMKLPLPAPASSDWDKIGAYLREDKDSPKPVTTIKFLLNLRPGEMMTLEDPAFEMKKGTKFNVTYTYCEKGRRISWGPIDDCAHFVSCCLLAGDLPVWPNDHPLVGGMSRPCCKGQHGVPGLYRMFKWMEKPENGKLAEIVVDKKPWKAEGQTDDAAAKEWNDIFDKRMTPGDVVMYHFKGKIGENKVEGFMHSALYVGTMKTKLDPNDYPRITCHTYSRFPTDECTWDDCRWDLNRTGEGWSYTLVHVTPYEPTEI